MEAGGKPVEISPSSPGPPSPNQDRAGREKTVPSDDSYFGPRINLFLSQNGLDNGVHFTLRDIYDGLGVIVVGKGRQIIYFEPTDDQQRDNPLAQK